jgi:hypothetical protein
VDGNSSNSRILTQLVPKTAVLAGETPASLDPSLPSIAEALAVMAGYTLLMSTRDAPFAQFFVRNPTPIRKNTKPNQLTLAELLFDR